MTAPRSRGKASRQVGQHAERRWRGAGDDEDAGAEPEEQEHLEQQRRIARVVEDQRGDDEDRAADDAREDDGRAPQRGEAVAPVPQAGEEDDAAGHERRAHRERLEATHEGLVAEARIGRTHELEERLRRVQAEGRVECDPGGRQEPDAGAPQDAPIARQHHGPAAALSDAFDVRDGVAVEGQGADVHERVGEEARRAQERPDRPRGRETGAQTGHGGGLEACRRAAPERLVTARHEGQEAQHGWHARRRGGAFEQARHGQQRQAAHQHRQRDDDRPGRWISAVRAVRMTATRPKSGPTCMTRWCPTRSARMPKGGESTSSATKKSAVKTATTSGPDCGATVLGKVGQEEHEERAREPGREAQGERRDRDGPDAALHGRRSVPARRADMLGDVVEPQPPSEIVALAEERSRARLAREWSRADDLRAAIEAAGWRIEDVGAAFRLQPAQPPDVEVDGRLYDGSVASIPSRLEAAASDRATFAILVSTSASPAGGAPLAPLTARTTAGVQVVIVAPLGVAVESADIELVGTATPFTAGDALQAALRRATGELIVVLADGSLPDDDILAPLEDALADREVAIVGDEGVQSTDLRRFSAAPARRGRRRALRPLCVPACRRHRHRPPSTRASTCPKAWPSG